MLDARDDASVTALAQALGGRHGGVDIVLSNAAARIFPQVPAHQQVRTFVDTSHGTLQMIKGFRPLLHDGARSIVVASSFGTLASLDPRLHHLFDVGRRPASTPNG
jgi:carbonyl reductase 1